MREDDAAAILRLWVEKAENTLELGEEAPTDTVAFHAQQCAEKYLKSLLVAGSIPFPKVHDLSEIMALVPEGRRPELSPEEERRLTGYATVTRYPGWYDPVTLEEAKHAVEVARRVRDEVRAFLPAEALG
jgi:HEPN domain-containing protein